MTLSVKSEACSFREAFSVEDVCERPPWFRFQYKIVPVRKACVDALMSRYSIIGVLLLSGPSLQKSLFTGSLCHCGMALALHFQSAFIILGEKGARLPQKNAKEEKVIFFCAWTVRGHGAACKSRQVTISFPKCIKRLQATA